MIRAPSGSTKWPKLTMWTSTLDLEMCMCRLTKCHSFHYVWQDGKIDLQKKNWKCLFFRFLSVFGLAVWTYSLFNVYVPAVNVSIHLLHLCEFLRVIPSSRDCGLWLFDIKESLECLVNQTDIVTVWCIIADIAKSYMLKIRKFYL